MYTSEKAQKYLLGLLNPTERKEYEESYFKDSDTFEDLLTEEEDLIKK